MVSSVMWIRVGVCRALGLAVAVALVATAVDATTALAAGTERPLALAPTEVTTTTALLNGELNPGQEESTTASMGTYEFVYRQSATQCEGTGEIKTAEGLALGGPKEPVSQAIAGLAPGTTYTVCVAVTNLENETLVSLPVTFEAALTPEAPKTLSPAADITATTATFEGTLNPKATVARNDGWHFAYASAVQGPACTEGATTAQEPEEKAKAKHEEVAVTGLEPGREYTFCMVATNSIGEATAGNPVKFKTPVARPAIESETVSGVDATAATLEAQVNPDNEKTTAHLQYATSATVNGSGGLTAPTVLASSELGEGYGAQAVGNGGLTSLPAGTTFYYQAVATNATGTTYGAVSSFTTVPQPATSAVSAITATSATFNGSLAPLNAAAATEYTFDYRAKKATEHETECTGEDATGSESAGTGAGTKAVSSEVTGLLPNTQYTVCLLATNTSGSAEASPVTFTTLVAAAAVEGESASHVDSSEVQLEARINPGNSETGYVFELGRAPGAYDESVPVPAGEIPPGFTGVSVSAPATGLEPNTTYHYRVVAANALPEKVDGADQTFTTAPAAAGGATSGGCPNEQLREEQPYDQTLPECRAYEMVSPRDTNGQDATSRSAEVMARASEAPTGTEPAITYSSKGSFGDPEGALVENQYLSRRTADGWTTQAITPLSSTPVEGVEGSNELNETSYPGAYFTPELTAGVAVSSARLGAAPPLGELNEGLYVDQFADNAYQYDGTIEDGGSNPPWGASTNLERVVLAKNGVLVEWLNGADVPVSVTNTNEELNAGAGSIYYEAAGKDAWHATSANGSRVYFTTPPTIASVGQLYVRVNVGKLQSNLGPKGECLEPERACTIEVSASRREPEDPIGPQSARFWGASAEGGKVFFTSDSELTPNAYTGPEDNGANLYEYDLETSRLTDLTIDEGDVAEGAAVQGVVQISEDGSYVYFVAKGALAAGASEQQCRAETEAEATGAEPKQENLGCNLYVSHEGGPPVFITTLAEKDEGDWQTSGSLAAGPAVNTAVLTPNGKQLAFISERSLSTANFPGGYDNEQAQPGECTGQTGNGAPESGNCREVYLYDAETASLVCASCNPAKVRPVGPASLPRSGGEPFVDYRSRDLLADGTLFFDSKDALAPGAAGGRGNVYEYVDGAVRAISAVSAGYESFFLDASANGENVFFASADRLLPEDPGGNTVVWDARVDGGFPAATAPASCNSSEECEPSPVVSSVVGPPASQTFSGPGNVSPIAPAPTAPAASRRPSVKTRAQKLAAALKTCRKDRPRRKRLTCEKTAHKRYGAVKKRTNASRERGVDR
jgi:hypothetical protein